MKIKVLWWLGVTVVVLAIAFEVVAFAQPGLLPWNEIYTRISLGLGALILIANGKPKQLVMVAK